MKRRKRIHNDVDSGQKKGLLFASTAKSLDSTLVKCNRYIDSAEAEK